MGTALITGATGGIGKAFAWQLAANHHCLVLVARDEDKLKQLAHQLKQIANVEAEVIVADLATIQGRKRVCQRLQTTTDTLPTVDLLVNNAGFGLGKDFTENDLATERAGLAVMVQAVIEITHAVLPHMKARGRGAILNVASVAALTAQGTYSAHKAWVKTFTESLAAELVGTGVQVTAVCPGLTYSEFHSRQGIDVRRWSNRYWTDPQLVAEVALQAVRNKQVIVTPKSLYWVASGVLRIMPRWLVRKIAGPKLSAHKS